MRLVDGSMADCGHNVGFRLYHVGIVAVVLALGCATETGRSGDGLGGGIASAGSSGASEDSDDGDGGAADTDSDPDDGDDGDDGPTPSSSDPVPELPYDPEQLGKLCARGNADRVAQALCSGADVSSMEELQELLAFENPFVAMTGNSSSLVSRGVTPLNPRLIVGEKMGGLLDDFLGQGDLEHLLALGFTRGEQLVELVGFDPVSDELNFYLLKFEQDCNDSAEGCSTADLVTPAVEQNWKRWTVYQDTDTANTTVDCAVCHQPMGPGTPKILRMQEMSNSWSHWFPTRPPQQQSGGWASGGNQTQGTPPSDATHGTHTSEMLWPQFERMHALESTYGGVPIETISAAESGPNLEAFVRNFMRQRDLPPELQIPESGAFPGGEGGDGQGGNAWTVDTGMTELMGPSFSWEQQFDEVVAGERLPVPSFRIDITDEVAREAAIASYMNVLTGVAPAETLVDPRETIRPDAMLEMSLVPQPDATAEEILSHMCSRCHNGSLDQSLSRARFNAQSLETADEATKAMIANRITRDHDDRLMMPPARAGTLPEWAIDRVLAWTEQ